MFAVAAGMLFASLLGLTWPRARKVRVLEDFVVAGRNLPLLAVAGSLAATWVGASALVEAGGGAYRRGLEAFVTPTVTCLALLATLFFAQTVRRHGELSILQRLEARFGPCVRFLGALALVAAYLQVLAFQLRVGGEILGVLFPVIEGGTAMAAMMLCVLPLALGGLPAVAFTDLVCWILAFVLLLVAAPWLLSEAGGFGAMMQTFPPGARELEAGPGRTAARLLPALLLVLCDANLHQRFSAVRTPEKARSSLLLAFALVLVLQTALVVSALAATALSTTGAISRPPAGEEHRILITAALEALPPWLAPPAYAALFALVLSTASSYLLTPACTFATDLFRRFLAPDLRADKYLFVARASVPVAALCALYLATSSDRVSERASLLVTLYTGALAPCLLAAYLWPRASARGALASMLVALLAGLGWERFTSTSVQDLLHGSGWVLFADLSQWATRSGLHPLLPTLVMGGLALLIVSLLSPPPEDEEARAYLTAPEPLAGSAGGETSST